MRRRRRLSPDHRAAGRTRNAFRAAGGNGCAESPCPFWPYLRPCLTSSRDCGGFSTSPPTRTRSRSIWRRIRMLAALVAARPGLRLPGAWDGFELAVRAILGQQMSVAAATALAGRLTSKFGETLRCFRPRADRMFSPSRTPWPKPISRASACRAIARKRCRACGGGRRRPAPVLGRALAGGRPGAASRACRESANGPRITSRCASCASRTPSPRPISACGAPWRMRRACVPAPAELLVRAEHWRPWRAYAAQYLWTRNAATARPAA